MTAHAIIVTGSRDWTDRRAIRDLLDHLSGKPVVVIHGAARGADALAAEHIASYAGSTYGTGNVVEVPMPAQWERYKRPTGKNPAGMVRNANMLQVLLALGKCGYETAVHTFCLAQSSGTRGMAELARAKGVRVVDHGESTE